MEYITGNKNVKLENTAVTLGKFDGLHLGHQLLIEKVRSYKEEGYKAVMFTFKTHPGNFFSKNIKQLYTEEEKVDLVAKMGIDYFVSYPFNEEIRSMEAEDFIKDILVNQLGAKQIVVGDDFRFGYNRKGDINLLTKLQEKYGYTLLVCKKKNFNDIIVSSSAIKETLEKGDMEKVNTLLGRDFSITSEVLHGRRIGRTLGMPTTNLKPKDNKYLPPMGVYASKTIIDGKSYNGVTSIGVKPTVVVTDEIGVETFIFDYDYDLYGKVITVEFCKYLREEIKFDSIDQLKEQMHVDMENAKDFFR